MPSLEIVVDAQTAGKRIDVVITRQVPDLSRDRVRLLFEAGEVRLNGKKAKKGDRVSIGDRVTIASLPPPVDFDAAPDPEMALRVCEVTDQYVVVDKPAGVPSHPLREGELGTLANALVARFPEMRGVGYRAREPGIVHRLDTGTSGLMLAARSQDAFEELREQLRSGAIEKRYLARCLGHVRAPQRIELPIATDPHNQRRVRACVDPREVKRLAPQPACTDVLSSEARGGESLVELRANHARRHQIRAHLAAIGHPLLGDALYGGPSIETSPYHQLHASQITIPGADAPVTSAWNYE